MLNNDYIVLKLEVELPVTAEKVSSVLCGMADSEVVGGLVRKKKKDQVVLEDLNNDEDDQGMKFRS